MTPAEPPTGFKSHASHWGAFRARQRADGSLEVHPHELDPDPYPLIENFTDALDHKTRIDRPYVRRGWLEGAPRSGRRARGQDGYVAMEWADVERLLADELRRVYDDHGPSAVFGGSYGWSSAGRFHHAQSQVHRFLNMLGGYTRSVNTYSLGAGEVIVPHVTGAASGYPLASASTFSDLIGNCELMVSFGGLPTKNTAVSAGGVTQHMTRISIRDLAESGCKFVNVSPLRYDLTEAEIERWIAPRPITDVPLMLAVCHLLFTTGRADLEFLRTYTVGWEVVRDYVLGVSDGLPKTPEWAAEICGLDVPEIRWLADAMSSRKTMITVTPSLQRAEHGEQPLWMAIALACVLGGVGLPGQGFSIGFGAMGNVGNNHMVLKLPSLPQGRNAAGSFIPVARISDLLLNPGGPFEYNGQQLTYPDIKLVYWAGGNPFHHHQDLFRLSEAFQRPDTVVVHDSFWTSTARHADIVLPATTTPERLDFGAANNDAFVIAMERLRTPYGQARDDYAIFAGVSEHLGIAEQFTEGRTADEWIRELYDRWLVDMAKRGSDGPDFDRFLEVGIAEVPLDPEPHSWLDYFRRDPVARPLSTPSGRIELFSQTIADFGYDDCLGHPAWLEPEEWLGGALASRYPLQLVANQPATRLHSQLDVGKHSREGKVKGREVMRMHPDDAKARNIVDGDLVRAFSSRAGFIAAVKLTDEIRRSVVQIPTGAWFDPDWDTRTCLHGNPNAVTLDRGTSKLAQGSIGQVCLVQVEKCSGPVRPVLAHEPPV